MRTSGRASVVLILPVLLTGVLAGRRPPQSDQAAQLLHPLFQDHAVLQRDRPINVYGETMPGAAVGVTLGSATAQARADANGHWRARLPAQRSDARQGSQPKSVNYSMWSMFGPVTSRRPTGAPRRAVVSPPYFCQTCAMSPLSDAVHYEGDTNWTSPGSVSGPHRG
jgi:hypothetical protein